MNDRDPARSFFYPLLTSKIPIPELFLFIDRVPQQV